MARSSTTFKPGQVTNPRGRPKLPPEVHELRAVAQGWSADMLKVAKRIADDPNASPQARIAAVNVILDRGWGRPGTTMDITSKGEGLQIGSFIVEGK